MQLQLGPSLGLQRTERMALKSWTVAPCANWTPQAGAPTETYSFNQHNEFLDVANVFVLSLFLFLYVIV